VLRNYILIIATLFALVFSGCSGGGGSSSSGNGSGGDGSSSSGNGSGGSGYSINRSSNNAIMGPLKDATVKVYKLTDLNNSIEEAQTGDLGAFSVNLNGIDDNEMLLVAISGGTDIDANDDGILDATPTVNNGTIRGLAKASDLKNGSVNVTLLSEVVYNYVKHLIGEVQQDDLEQAMNTVSAKLLKENINREAISYRDINNFVPINSESKNKLDFDYSILIGTDSFATIMHSHDVNSSIIESKLNSLFSSRLTLNSDNLKSNNNFYKIEVVPGFNSDISSIGSSLFVNQDNNSSKLKDFIAKDSNVSFTVNLGDNVKINGWTGCDIISADGLTCSIQNISHDRQVSPSIVYKESILNNNVKDITNYFVTINDSNYTVSLDLDANSSSRDFIESIAINDVMVANGTSQRFARKVLSKLKVDNYNYIFETEEVSILDVFSQAGISFNRNLTHDDLVNTSAINRSLRAHGMQLEPPRFKGDDLFTIAPMLHTGNNRSLEAGETWKIWESDDKTQAVSIQGKLSFKLKPIIDINTRLFSVKSVKVAYQIENIGEVRLIATQGLNIEKKLSLIDFMEGRIVTGDNVQHDGWEPKGLEFDILLPYFKATVKVPVFVGVEGSTNTALSFGVGWNTKETIGMSYSNDESSIIKSSTRNYKLLGEIPGTNIEISIGAFLEPQPSIVFYNFIGLGVNIKAGPYIVAKAGGEYNDDFLAGVSLKLNADIGLTPKLTSGSLMPNYFSVKLHNINTKFLANTSLRASKTIWERSYPTDINPAYLEVDTVQINETLYADESFMTDYIFTIRNTGDKDLHWSLDTSGYLPSLLNISKENGILGPNDSEQITISGNINDLSNFAGQTWRGTLKFINNDKQENYVEENILAEVKTRLPAPSSPVNAAIEGISLKELWIYGFNSYIWPESAGANDVDRGFKFYISDYNETSGSCIDSNTTSFLTAINEYENQSEMENDLVRMNFEDVKRIHHIEGGKKYCIRHTAYYRNTESGVNEGNSALYIPKYAKLTSSIKDMNNNPLNATITLTTLSNHTTSDTSGNYNFDEMMPGRYLITIKAEGYTTKTDEITLVEGETYLYEQTLTTPTELEGITGVYNGSIKDALSGDKISNVSIDIREGRNITTGAILTTITSDVNGNYTVELPTGEYTFNLSKSGYIITNDNILVVGNETRSRDLSISPVLSYGAMRIRLNWAHTPNDLDSHLVKKTGENIDYHIYYNNNFNGDDNLDIDDTDGDGPETITISNLDSTSDYSYYVYNYSEDADLKDSSAKVHVNYENNSTVYSVPNEDGRYWKVFDIENGVIIPCTSNCIQDTIYSGVSRNIDRKLLEERKLFQNLSSK